MPNKDKVIELKSVCASCDGAGIIRTPEDRGRSYPCPASSGCGGKGYILLRYRAFKGLRVIPGTIDVNWHDRGTSVAYEAFLQGERPA